jgi:hypothetical protein
VIKAQLILACASCLVVATCGLILGIRGSILGWAMVALGLIVFTMLAINHLRSRN